MIVPKNFKGLPSLIWGPHAWALFHAVALSYPDNPTPFDKENYKSFFMSLQHVLPCQKCRSNFLKHIGKVSITNYLDNSDKLHEWVTIMHNLASKVSNGKVWTIQESKRHWSDVFAGKKKILSKQSSKNIKINVEKSKSIKQERFQDENYDEPKSKPYTKVQLICICIIVIILIILIHFLVRKYLK